MLFGILLTVQIIICLVMGGLILIQQSEGGALGMGGGPSGFMSARGAGNLLTRLTAIFGVLFFANSIGLTIVGNLSNRGASAVDQIDTSKLTLPTSSAPPAVSTQAASSSSSQAAPSLNDLPLANAPVAATPQSTAAQAGAQRPVVLPQPAKLPIPAMPQPSSADVSKAKAGIWDKSSAAAKPASSPAPSSPN